jgi:hypothetical protein
MSLSEGSYPERNLLTSPRAPAGNQSLRQKPSVIRTLPREYATIHIARSTEKALSGTKSSTTIPVKARKCLPGIRLSVYKRPASTDSCRRAFTFGSSVNAPDGGREETLNTERRHRQQPGPARPIMRCYAPRKHYPAIDCLVCPPIPQQHSAAENARGVRPPTSQSSSWALDGAATHARYHPVTEHGMTVLRP